MKKVLLMAGLLAGMTFMGMAQTAPAKKEVKTEKQHHKSDTTSKSGGSAHKMKANKKH